MDLANDKSSWTFCDDSHNWAEIIMNYEIAFSFLRSFTDLTIFVWKKNDPFEIEKFWEIGNSLVDMGIQMQLHKVYGLITIWKK